MYSVFRIIHFYQTPPLITILNTVPSEWPVQASAEVPHVFSQPPVYKGDKKTSLIKENCILPQRLEFLTDESRESVEMMNGFESFNNLQEVNYKQGPSISTRPSPMQIQH